MTEDRAGTNAWPGLRAALWDLDLADQSGLLALLGENRDQREVHAMVSPMWLDASCVSMRNANTCAGVPGGATVKLSATRLKPPTQEPNLRSFYVTFAFEAVPC